MGEQSVAAYLVPGEQRVYLLASRLPPPRHSYQAWFLGSGRAWHGGTLRVRDGVGMLVVRTDPERWRMIMLADEPSRGFPHPGSSPLVSATLSAGDVSE